MAPESSVSKKLKPHDDVLLPSKVSVSPASKKQRKGFVRKIQRTAFNELLTMLAANGGSTHQYGAIKAVITQIS